MPKDADLAAVIEAWDRLPEAVRAIYRDAGQGRRWKGGVMAPRTKPKNKGGRPAKWNTETAFALGLALQGRYTTPAEAARKAGIGKSTLFRWLPRSSWRSRFAPLVARMTAIQENWPWL